MIDRAMTRPLLAVIIVATIALFWQPIAGWLLMFDPLALCCLVLPGAVFLFTMLTGIKPAEATLFDGFTRIIFRAVMPRGKPQIDTKRSYSEHAKYDAAMRQMDSRSFPEISHEAVINIIRQHPEWSVAETTRQFKQIREQYIGGRYISREESESILGGE